MDHVASSPEEVDVQLADPNQAPQQKTKAKKRPVLTNDDIGNAKRLVSHFGKEIRYCKDLKKWLAWDSQRWVEGDDDGLMNLAKETARRIYHEAGNAAPEDRSKLGQHANRSAHISRLKAMIELARSEPNIRIKSEDLDRDPWLLNVKNGTIDLRTGELREHRKEDLITKLAPVEFDPAAKCPQFEAFLDQIMGGNKALVDYLQRIIGYSLTGSTRGQCLFLLYGTGANGKSTFIEIIRALMGDYTKQADFATFLKSLRDGDGPRNDIARLAGARFVSALEAGGERRLNEVVIKQITGGDAIAARFLHQEYFEFIPQLKLFLVANHKPRIEGMDHGIWRRIKQIPFEVAIPEAERDHKLLEKLKAELPGILAWAVQGCLQWQREGLAEPEEVKQATQEYREEMDPLEDFLRDCCELDANASVTANELYGAYHYWCISNMETLMAKNQFGSKLREKGFESGRFQFDGKQQRGWKGIALKNKDKQTYFVADGKIVATSPSPMAN